MNLLSDILWEREISNFLLYVCRRQIHNGFLREVKEDEEMFSMKTILWSLVSSIYPHSNAHIHTHFSHVSNLNISCPNILFILYNLMKQIKEENLMRYFFCRLFLAHHRFTFWFFVFNKRRRFSKWVLCGYVLTTTTTTKETWNSKLLSIHNLWCVWVEPHRELLSIFFIFFPP